MIEDSVATIEELPSKDELSAGDGGLDVVEDRELLDDVAEVAWDDAASRNRRSINMKSNRGSMLLTFKRNSSSCANEIISN